MVGGTWLTLPVGTNCSLLGLYPHFSVSHWAVWALYPSEPAQSWHSVHKKAGFWARCSGNFLVFLLAVALHTCKYLHVVFGPVNIWEHTHLRTWFSFGSEKLPGSCHWSHSSGTNAAEANHGQLFFQFHNLSLSAVEQICLLTTSYTLFLKISVQPSLSQKTQFTGVLLLL